MVATAPSRPRWLFGPVPDLLLGCGGIYAFVFAALSISAPTVHAIAPQAVLPIIILLTSVPHYGATLLRVYERRSDRQHYRFFALWASLAVYAWLAVGVYDVPVGSLLVTTYLTWSPWHYSGQNYGIALMFLGRRGVSVGHTAKRCLHLSFVLSCVIAILHSHSGEVSTTYASEAGA